MYIISFLDFIGASLIVPVFGSHLRSLGMTHFQISLLLSSYSAVQLLSGPIIGNLSDRYGRRLIIFTSLFICAICYSTLSVISHFFIILIIRLALGTFKHTQNLCKALVADCMPHDQQSMAYGKLNSATSFGFMIGPVIGGHIVESKDGFQLVAILTSIVFVINSLIAYYYIPEMNVLKRNESNANNQVKLKLIFKDLLAIDWKYFWDIFLLKFVFTIAMFVFYSNYSLLLEEKFNLSHKYIGYTISFKGVIAVTMGLLVGRLKQLYSENTSHQKIIFHAFIGLTVSFLLLVVVPNFIVYIVFIVPLTLCSSLLRIVTTEVLFERTTPEYRGLLIGTSNSVASMARLLSPLIAGLTLDKFGPNYVPLVSSVLAGIAAILSLGFSYHRNKNI